NPVAVTDTSLSPLAFNSSDNADNKLNKDTFQGVSFLKNTLNSNTKQLMEGNICDYELNYNSEKNIRGIIYPVVLDRKVIRYLHIWEFSQSIKEVDFIALSHAATVIALDAMKYRIVSETNERLTEDFISDLLENRIKS